MPASLIGDPTITTAVRELLDRAERQEDTQHLVATFVDPGGLAGRLYNDNNQILYGRRGTGKTHMLSVLSTERPGLSVYVDLRNVAETPKVGDAELPAEVRVASLMQLLFQQIASSFSDYLQNASSDRRRASSAAHQRFVAVASAATLDDERVTRETSVEQTSESSAGVGAELSGTGPRVSAKLDARDASSSSALSRVEGGRRIPTITFADVDEALTALIEASGAGRVLILLDEWSEVPYALQPLFADYIKRAFFANRRVTIKVAAVEHRSKFFERDGREKRVGFEPGADIATGLELDEFFTYQRDPDRVVGVFRELLYRHVSVGAALVATSEVDPRSWRLRFRLAGGRRQGNPLLRELFAAISDELSGDELWGRNFVDRFGSAYMDTTFGVSGPEQMIEEMFTGGGDSFHELVHASQGVVRDFIHVFAKAFDDVSSSGRNKIDRPTIRAAARDWYLSDKVRFVHGTEDRVFQAIVDFVIANGESDLFFIGKESEEREQVQSLYDLRLVHLIRRGCGLPGHVGRFSQYAIDYGTYVDFDGAAGRKEQAGVGGILVPDDVIVRAIVAE